MSKHDWEPAGAAVDADQILLEHPPSEDDDAARADRIHAEISAGFAALADVGRAVSVFGSARARPDEADY